MDRSLWLLLKLRTGSQLRRWGRNVRTLKGVLLMLAGALIFAPLIFSFIFVPRVFVQGQVALIRQHGALGLLAYCLLNVLASTGERAVTYSPAEINFLFCGPFRPRQLLLYKIIGGLLSGLFMSVVFTLVFGIHTYSSLAAFAGLFLTLELFSLFTLAVSLFASTIGAAAFDRRRKLALALTLGLAAVVLFQEGRDVAALGPKLTMERIEGSWLVRPLLLPFVPFVRTFTALRIWPDLATWSALALAVDLGLVGLVLGLNARNLEASANASARLYERIKLARRGAAWTGPPTVRFRLPPLPWWGGLGPNLWRQLLTALRGPSRLSALMIFYLMPLAMMVAVAREGPTPSGISPGVPALIVLVSLAIFTPTMIGYDFRPDLHRMELLKTLPIRPLPLVLGQLATPTLILTLSQWIVVGLIQAFARLDPILFTAFLVLSPPFNFLMVELENLSFLWFPGRWVGGNTVDFQTMGRQMVVMMAKLACALGMASVAAGLGAAGYFLFQESWSAAVGLGWLTVAGCAASMVPLLTQAFRQFDVARDRLE